MCINNQKGSRISQLLANLNIHCETCMLALRLVTVLSAVTFLEQPAHLGHIHSTNTSHCTSVRWSKVQWFLTMCPHKGHYNRQPPA